MESAYLQWGQRQDCTLIGYTRSRRYSVQAGRSLFTAQIMEVPAGRYWGGGKEGGGRGVKNHQGGSLCDGLVY